MNYQETIERELNCLDKSAKYILLCICYHLNRCKNIVDCSMCTFILDLQYLYVEKLVNGNIENLKEYCRLH